MCIILGVFRNNAYAPFMQILLDFLRHFIVFIAIVSEFLLFLDICKCLCLANRKAVDLEHVDRISSYLRALKPLL